MAFISALATFVTTTLGITSTIGALLVRTAVSMLVSYALNRTISKGQTQTGFDPGVRQMLAPATNHKIPIVYGSAYLGGAITDARLVNDNKTMWVCLTISEVTGPLFSTGSASSYTFNEAYRGSNKIIFETDGITVAKTLDAEGNEDASMAGLIKIYMYAGSGSSADQIAPAADSVVGNVAPTLTAVNAWDQFPDWVAPAGSAALNDNMSDLVFALVKVEYNRDKNVTQIGDYQFNIINSMYLQGDVIFDYATNTRYGAGIRLAEISTGESSATTISRMSLNTYPWIDLS